MKMLTHEQNLDSIFNPFYNMGPGEIIKKGQLSNIVKQTADNIMRTESPMFLYDEESVLEEHKLNYNDIQYAYLFFFLTISEIFLYKKANEMKDDIIYKMERVLAKKNIASSRGERTESNGLLQNIYNNKEVNSFFNRKNRQSLDYVSETIDIFEEKLDRYTLGYLKTFSNKLSRKTLDTFEQDFNKKYLIPVLCEFMEDYLVNCFSFNGADCFCSNFFVTDCLYYLESMYLFSPVTREFHSIYIGDNTFKRSVILLDSIPVFVRPFIVQSLIAKLNYIFNLDDQCFYEYLEDFNNKFNDFDFNKLIKDIQERGKEIEDFKIYINNDLNLSKKFDELSLLNKHQMFDVYMSDKGRNV